MDIRLLGEADINEAKGLWSEAFGDSDRFTDWYFANKVLPGNSVGAFDVTGGLISVVHTIPFEVCVQGRPLESAFIAGAATAKAWRGQGLMRTLLLETLKLLKSRGIVMTHLYPFKHSFYESFGWATYSYVNNKNIIIQGDHPAGDVIETGDWRLLAPLYNRMMGAFDGYIIRNEREWEWRIGECTADRGKAALLIKNGAPAAYMLYYNNDGEAEIIETVYNKEEDLYPLLKYVSGKGKRSAAYSVPATEPPGAAPYGTEPHGAAPYGTESRPAVPYGMARVVDARALLKLFGAEEVLDHIRITDDFAGWNNVGEGVKTDAGALAKMVHRGAKSILSDDECSICNGLLKKVFSPRATCIFEQY